MRIIIATALLALATTSVAAQCVTPGLEDFETGVTGTASCTTTTPGTLPTGWTRDAASTFPWIVDNAGTTSSNTGPPADHTTGTAAGVYVYVETSFPCSNRVDTAILVSPCYDVSAFTSGTTTLTLNRHMWGADIGTLIIEESDGAGGWVELGRVSGDQGNAWIFDTYPLTAPGGQVQVRFTAISTGTSFDGDIALDDIEVVDGAFFRRWQGNNDSASLVLAGADPVSPLELDGGSVDSRSVSTCPGVTPMLNEAGELTVSSTLGGQTFEIGYNLAPIQPLSPPNTLVTPDGDIVNLDIFGAGLGYVFGGFYPANQPLPGNFLPGGNGGELTITFEATAPVRTSVQSFVTDPASLIGLRLSAAAQFEVENQVITPMLPASGPTGDDSVLTVDLAAAPACSQFAVSLFGTAVTELAVDSNGRVGESGLVSDFSASPSDALGDPGFFGFWTDLTPAGPGSIDFTSPAPGQLSVNYNGLVYFGQVETVTFSVIFDDVAGTVTIDGLQATQLNPATDGGGSAFIGMSPGVGAGATDPGVTAFTPGGFGMAAAPTDLLYDFYDAPAAGAGAGAALPAVVAAGVNSITFTWNGTSYDGSAL